MACTRCCFGCFQGNFVALFEILPASEPAGLDETENRPEVAGGVFDRGAGEGDSSGGIELGDGLGMICVRVADQRRLVDHGDGVLLLQMPGEIPGEGAIGGEDDVARADRVAEAVALRPVEDDDFAAGGEAGELSLPVPKQGGGDNDQGRSGVWRSCEQVLDGGDRLQGFSKAHVVRQEGTLITLQPIDQP